LEYFNVLFLIALLTFVLIAIVIGIYDSIKNPQTKSIDKKDIIQKAIKKKQDIMITYKAKDGELTNRQVTPIKLYQMIGYYGLYYDV